MGLKSTLDFHFWSVVLAYYFLFDSYIQLQLSHQKYANLV